MEVSSAVVPDRLGNAELYRLSHGDSQQDEFAAQYNKKSMYVNISLSSFSG